MTGSGKDVRLRLDALFRETVTVGEQARFWFDGPGLRWRRKQPAHVQARVATESLATTARLLAVMAWLLDPRHAGDDPRLTPFQPGEMPLPEPDLPAGHPLTGRPGAEIARRARILLRETAALAAEDSR